MKKRLKTQSRKLKGKGSRRKAKNIRLHDLPQGLTAIKVYGKTVFTILTQPFPYSWNGFIALAFHGP
jgi:hypothetical protein